MDPVHARIELVDIRCLVYIHLMMDEMVVHLLEYKMKDKLYYVPSMEKDQLLQPKVLDLYSSPDLENIIRNRIKCIRSGQTYSRIVLAKHTFGLFVTKRDFLYKFSLVVHLEIQILFFFLFNVNTNCMNIDQSLTRLDCFFARSPYCFPLANKKTSSFYFS